MAIHTAAMSTNLNNSQPSCHVCMPVVSRVILNGAVTRLERKTMLRLCANCPAEFPLTTENIWRVLC